MHFAFLYHSIVTHLSVLFNRLHYNLSMFNKTEIYMTKRTIILLLTSVLMASCAATNQPVAEKDQDILHIYPDGKMVFDGRIMNEEDVVIYDDGHGGERAAIKLLIPLSRYKTQNHAELYRDTIIVDRKAIDVLDEQGG